MARGPVRSPDDRFSALRAQSTLPLRECAAQRFRIIRITGSHRGGLIKSPSDDHTSGRRERVVDEQDVAPLNVECRLARTVTRKLWPSCTAQAHLRAGR